PTSWPVSLVPRPCRPRPSPSSRPSGRPLRSTTTTRMLTARSIHRPDAPRAAAAGRKGSVVESVEATGRTVDEAIENALDELGLERDDVTIEVLAPAAQGRAARVRVTPLEGLEFEDDDDDLDEDEELDEEDEEGLEDDDLDEDEDEDDEEDAPAVAVPARVPPPR